MQIHPLISLLHMIETKYHNKDTNHPKKITNFPRKSPRINKKNYNFHKKNSSLYNKEEKKASLKESLRKFVHCFSFLLLGISCLLLVEILYLQPKKAKDSFAELQNLYYSQTPIVTPLHFLEGTNPTIKNSDTQDAILPIDDTLLKKEPLPKFQKLLEKNNEVKGWISIPGTNINYPVLQSSKEYPDYYLTRNIEKEEDRFGSIYLDICSDIDKPSKCLLLHGHNMTSTGTMFHELMKYKDLDFLKENPIIQFDTLYEEGRYKVFAVFKTNGSSAKEDLFDYQRGDFQNDFDFLNFIYQITLRSIFSLPVMLKEEDELLLLSTCSYELPNYRTVIASRKLRENEPEEYDTTLVKKNNTPLYPDSWYQQYGGVAPVYKSLKEALKYGTLLWYDHDN